MAFSRHYRESPYGLYVSDFFCQALWAARRQYIPTPPNNMRYPNRIEKLGSEKLGSDSH